MHHSIPRLSVLLVLLGGCGVKLPGDEGSSSGGGGEESSSTLGNSSAPTTGEAAETGGTLGSDTAPPPETSGTSTATTSPTSSDLTSDGDSGFTVTTLEMTSGNDTDPELPACDVLCQHEGECGLGDGEEACLATCEAGLDSAEQECVEVTELLIACMSGLSCDELEAVLEDELGHPCNTEQLNVHTLCNPGLECDFGGGGDFEGNSCELEIWCPGDPERRMDCDKEQCICKLGGEQVATCPAEAVCDDLQTLDDKGVSCCGFPQVDL